MTASLPLVSCIMPTANRRRFVPLAIRYFLAQDYPHKELLILDDGQDSVADLIPQDPGIRYFRETQRRSLGGKRNALCEKAKGEIIVHWDDDDWSASRRLSYQVRELLESGADICGLDRVLFINPKSLMAWEYVHQKSSQPWVYGATFCYRRALWLGKPFPEVNIGEDSRFIWNARGSRISVLPDNRFLVSLIHDANTSRKHVRQRCWQQRPLKTIQEIMGSEWSLYSGEQPMQVTPDSSVDQGAALVTAAAGIGDLIRITPLIRVLHILGYQVDVLLAPDYPEAVDLLRGAAEIRSIFHYPNLSRNRGAHPLPEMHGKYYEVATFTAWSLPLAKWVQYRQSLTLARNEWQFSNYVACIEKLARAVGWEGTLPEPFAMASDRKFDLPPETVALHPGCNPNWSWKKWHGFDRLAHLLPNVVIVGSESDLDNSQTYFHKAFEFPTHAQNFIGQLNLLDTAALLKQCGALIANDSGLMHLGVALGIPTFGIFGITSPEREAIPSPLMFPITKNLACEPACRQRPWGRRNCKYNLECLRTLMAEEVLNAMQSKAGILRKPKPVPQPSPLTGKRPALRFALVFSGGIGDLIISSCLAYELYEAAEMIKCDVFFHSPEVARFVFRGASFVQQIKDARELSSTQHHYDAVVYVSQYARYDVKRPDQFKRWEPKLLERIEEATSKLLRYRGLLDKQPQLDAFWARLCVKMGINRLSGIGYLANLPISKDSEYVLNPDESEYGFWLQTIGGHERPYCTIHDGFDNNFQLAKNTATKCWTYEHWEELVRLVKERFPTLRVVQLGGRCSRPIRGVDVNLINKTNLSQAAWIIKQATIHIDGDSGLVHLARALHTKCIVLFGPTTPEFFGYDLNINLPPKECGDCWWETRTWLAECPRGLGEPACMKSILPQEVLSCLEGHMASLCERRLEVGELTLFSGKLLQEREWQLADMFEQTGIKRTQITEHSWDSHSGLYIHASKQWEYLFALKELEKLFPDGMEQLRIADVGGGRGALPAYLAKLGHQVDVYDINYLWDSRGDEWVEKRYMQWARTNGYTARFGSVYNLPSRDESYDVVTSISVVEHVPHKVFAVKEALRILRPGGLLILTFDFAPHPEKFRDSLRVEIFGPELLAATLAALGLQLPAVSPETIQKSASDIQSEKVLGIPVGMTVGGLIIRKLAATEF